MAQPWDQRTIPEQRRIQNTLVNATLVQMALAHIPFARARLQAAGLDARLLRKVEDLQKVPLSMRRDVLDPARNPDGPQGFVLKGTAEGMKRFADRRVLWRVALSRLFGGEEVQQLAIEGASRGIHVHLADGPGGVIPVSYTRDDLDLLARAGARLAQVAGIDREDRLLNVIPFGATLDFWGIFYMAHGVGLTAVHTRREGADLAAALYGFEAGPPSAVTVPADEAAEFPALAKAAGVKLDGLRVLLAVGRSLTRTERERIGAALAQAGAPMARIAAAYGVTEGRVLWGECAVPAGTTDTFGFHTFPDMEVVEVVDPETGATLPEEQPGEIVITPLGFRGGGAPRWRSGDLALGGLSSRPCPNCGRTIPRVGPSVRRNAWRRRVRIRGRNVEFDFREAAAALAGVRDWHVEVRPDGAGADLFVYVAGTENDVGPVISLYETLDRWDVAPTQIVLASLEDITAKHRANEATWPRFSG